MNLLDWLPTPPWLGPPLPRFLGIRWPAGQSVPAIEQVFKGPQNFLSQAFSNEEVEEVKRDERGFIIERRITRHVRRD